MICYFFYSELHQINDIPGINTPGTGIQAFAAESATVYGGKYLFLFAPACKADHTAEAVIVCQGSRATRSTGSATHTPVHRGFFDTNKINDPSAVFIEINLPVFLY
jgi:hypothetical protein